MSSPRRAFTLIELLIVIGIVALLVGLILPAVQRVRESAARADCLNRIRNNGLAVLNYESAHGRLPPGGVQGPFAPAGAPDGVSHGMWPLVLGFLDQKPVADLYHLDKPFDDPANRPATAALIRVLMCPGLDPARTQQWDTPPGVAGVADYAPVEVNPFLADIALIDAVGNFEPALPVNGTVRLTDVTDGTSNTLLLVEAAGRPGMAWCDPALPVSLRFVFGVGPHRLGAHVTLCDGSARFVRESVGLRLLAKLATRSGGEVIDADW
jgi:prepilin-type N-terminal cleavage/methylation domain-containing protein